MLEEIISSKSFFPKGTKIDTVYFGGGTPSLLKPAELKKILEALANSFDLSKLLELTMEANPDDLSLSYIMELKSLNINRLSIGVQSLNDGILQWMNRSHNVAQAKECIKNAQEAGIEHINIDLIFGVPGLSNEQWRATVREVLSWPIDHLSAYALTLEEKTAYAHFVKQGKYKAPPDETCISHYEILQEEISAAGWEHYEVSNYCRDGAYAKHNTAYWTGKPYLGIGPSAHGFDGESRYWNVASNASYMQFKGKPSDIRTFEVLSEEDKANEKIMTSLRTKWGLSLKEFESKFSFDIYKANKQQLKQWESDGLVSIKDGILRLTDEGLLVSDGICAELFIDHSSHTSS